MRELLRSNDLVKLSWLEALLRDAGIDCLILDHHSSSMEGSINAIARRVMVSPQDWLRARRLLDELREGEGT